jgi:hypothetical protein
VFGARWNVVHVGIELFEDAADEFRVGGETVFEKFKVNSLVGVYQADDVFLQFFDLISQ